MYNMMASFIGVECHFQHMSVILYNMATSFIGVEHHFQQYVSYPV
jgi:hypothetical protein